MKKLIAVVLVLSLMSGLAGWSSNGGNNLPKEQMPQSFSVRFSWWIIDERKNIMDTEAGLLQKDLVSDGISTAEFQPDQDFMQGLYELICGGSLLNIKRKMTSRELATGDTLLAMTPNTYYEIAVNIDGKQFLISGDQTASGYTDTDEEALCFINTVTELIKSVKNIPEWQALPASNGAYQ